MKEDIEENMKDGGGPCEHCRTWCDELTIDPFLQDVYNETVEKYLCERCYQSYCDDI